jgi:hypothetical protein
VLFSAGALASVRLALSDLVALAILAGALLAVERGRIRWGGGALAAASLARETSLVALAGFVERPWFSWKNLRRVFAAVAPLAAWLAYVRFRAGAADQGWSNFTLPVGGLVEKWRAALAATRTIADQPLAWTTLLATLGLTVQAVFFLTRWRPADRWWRLGAVYTIVLLCLGTAVWEGFPGAATRVLLPLTLAFNVLVHRSRAPLAWLLAGNLTIFAGLLALRDVPREPHELAAVRAHGTAAVAQLGDGWYGLEQSHGRRWTWSGARGVVRVEAWPKHAGSLQLAFALRSMAPGTVVVAQNGREIARFAASARLESHAVPFALGADGRTTLEFSTDAPAVPESANADARRLAFALYDARLVVTEQ